MQYNLRSEIAKVVSEETQALEGNSHTFSTTDLVGIFQGSMYAGACITLETFVHNVKEQSENRGYDLTQEEIMFILDTFKDQAMPVLDAMEEEILNDMETDDA